MFTKNKKIIKEYEEKIALMSDHLDAWIETYKGEIDFNTKLLEIDNAQTKEQASKEIEKAHSALWVLVRLKCEHDKLFKTKQRA